MRFNLSQIFQLIMNRLTKKYFLYLDTFQHHELENEKGNTIMFTIRNANSSCERSWAINGAACS